MKIKNFLFLILVISALGLFAACSGNTDAVEEPIELGISDVTGWYFVDLHDAGMPMVVFLEIKEDETFTLFNRLDDGDDRGNGIISGLDGTFMLLYSDGDRRATFTIADDANLIFTSTLPFGTVNINPSSFPNESIIAVRILPDRSNLTSTDDSVSSIISLVEGRYAIDTTSLETLARVYLMIEKDGTFVLTDRMEGGEFEVSGKADAQMGGYTLVYDNVEMGSVSFKTSDEGLVFDGPIPFGIEQIISDNNESVMAYLIADDYEASVLDEKESDDIPSDEVEEQAEDPTPEAPEVAPEPTPELITEVTPEPVAEVQPEPTPQIPPGTTGTYTLKVTHQLEAMGGITQNLTMTIDLDANTFHYFGEQITAMQGTMETSFSGTITGNPNDGFIFDAPNSTTLTNFTGTVVQTATGQGIEFPAQALLSITGFTTIVLDGFNY